MTARSTVFRAALAAFLLLSAPLPPAGPAGAAEATRFVAGLGDVPAMPGLVPLEGESLVFDKPAGRIVEAVLQGRVERKAVQGFYARTMPQLGWRRIADDRFQREGEELRLEYVDRGAAAPTTVRFILTPR